MLRSGRVANLRAEIEKFLEGLEAVEAVIETGRSSYAMVDVLEEMGVVVKIAHPNEVKAIARPKIKTDKQDRFSGAFRLVRGPPAPFGRFQLNLTSDDAPM